MGWIRDHVTRRTSPAIARAEAMRAELRAEVERREQAAERVTREVEQSRSRDPVVGNIVYGGRPR